MRWGRARASSGYIGPIHPTGRMHSRCRLSTGNCPEAFGHVMRRRMHCLQPEKPGRENKKGSLVAAFFVHGAGNRNRTYDLIITNDALYQLSYSGGSRILGSGGGCGQFAAALAHAKHGPELAEAAFPGFIAGLPTLLPEPIDASNARPRIGMAGSTQRLASSSASRYSPTRAFQMPWRRPTIINATDERCSRHHRAGRRP